MYYHKLFIVLFTFIISALYGAAENRVEFAIVVPSFNNIQWIEQNLRSVFSQEYENFHLYYYDDASTDGTGEFVDTFIENYGLQEKCTIIHNESRQGALANFYSAVHSLKPETVVVMLDGDDKLANGNVLTLLANIYSDKKVWMTFGSFQKSDGAPKEEVYGMGTCCGPCPEWVRNSKSFRQYSWFASHLRTCYAKLFQLILKEDLMINGTFYSAAGDLGMMFPMLEMSSNDHFRFIPEVLYLYNQSNPISDSYANLAAVLQNEAHIRTLPVYETLETLF